MIIVDGIKQGTPEWLALRLGIPTSSEYKRIITPSGEPSKSTEKYLNELLGERFTGRSKDQYVSYDMQRGSENEPIARSLFEFMYGVEVTQVAFCYPDESRRTGVSPDGLILSKIEGLEIKDARPDIQIDRLRHGWKWKEHYPQIQGCLSCSGYNIWHLMSHFPGLDPIIIKVERDNEFCAKLKVLLEEFCDELDEIEKELGG